MGEVLLLVLIVALNIPLLLQIWRIIRRSTTQRKDIL